MKAELINLFREKSDGAVTENHYHSSLVYVFVAINITASYLEI